MTNSSGDPLARARLDAVEIKRARDGTCRVEVKLTGPEGLQVEGTIRCHDTPPALTRAGAQATIRALTSLDPLDDSRIRLSLTGVKSLRAFDARVVIVAVRARMGERREDLLGAVEAPSGDLCRGGVIATLNAVNRLLSKEMSPAGSDEAVGRDGLAPSP